MPVDSDTGKQIAILEKKIRILERKLQRSEESRKQIESVKDRSDHFQKSVIEETKEQQETLRRINAEKEQQLHELSKARRAMLNIMQDLDQAKQEAEEATRSKSDFLANMSHEIRTPMNAVIGLNYLLLKTELSGQQQDYVEKIKLSAENLLAIINDILDFSKIEAGKLSVENTEFDLSDVLNNLASLVAPKAHEKGLDFLYSWDTDLPRRFIGDPTRIGQILLNLVGNAVKFTHQGEIEVRIDCKIQADDSTRLDFRVRDTGIGLTPEQILNLFNAFSQADSSTTRKYGGTGLGLSICRRLAELMGGAVEAESTFGEGSTFHVSLTVGTAEDQSSHDNIIPDELGEMNVLVVCSHRTVREMIGGLLKDFGLNTTIASTNTKALEAVRLAETGKNPYNLIIIDQDRNGVVDLSMIEEIPSPKSDKPVKFILLVDYGQDGLTRKAEAIGVDTVILKPVTHSSLFDAVMNVISGRQSKRVIETTQQYSFSDGRSSCLLLVEDNEINQQVARELLESAGFLVEIAENGKEAVEAINSKKYDLVLMDLQMPVMDGYEAVRHIRNSGIEDLPIVAMTADAMSGVKEKVLEYGMNGYVTKPIRPDRLFGVLLDLIPGLESFDIDSMPMITTDLSVFDGILDHESALFRVGGDPEFYGSLLESFKNDFTSFRERLLASEKESREKSVRLAHSMKGVSGNLGASKIHDIADKIEQALIAGEMIERFDTELSEIDDWFTLFNTRYETWDSGHDNSTEEPIASRAINEEDIEHLASLMKTLDPSVTEELARLKPSLAAIDTESTKAMIKSVGRYDFQGAQAMLDKIVERMRSDE